MTVERAGAGANAGDSTIVLSSSLYVIISSAGAGESSSCSGASIAR